MTAPADVIDIVRAEPGDEVTLAELASQAFAPLRIAEWLVPVESDRERVIASRAQLAITEAFSAGVVLTTRGRNAFAVWLPIPSFVPEPDPARIEPAGRERAQVLADACGGYARRFRRYDAILACHHPSTAGHHYLAMLAVRPGLQHEGIGSALLRPHHAFLDHHSTPAYTVTPWETESFYTGHGYYRRGSPIELSGGALVLPMWRPASRFTM
jgi:ribosomal protein S18 acetylase RimI-like enzyme